jgi:hypothetical protein
MYQSKKDVFVCTNIGRIHTGTATQKQLKHLYDLGLTDVVEYVETKKKTTKSGKDKKTKDD